MQAHCYLSCASAFFAFLIDAARAAQLIGAITVGVNTGVHLKVPL
jgi:hypothetical protein